MQPRGARFANRRRAADAAQRLGVADIGVRSGKELALKPMAERIGP
jgi:hypothetical protein